MAKSTKTLQELLQPLLKDDIKVATDEDGGRRVPSSMTFYRGHQIILFVNFEGGDEMGGWAECFHD